MTMRQKIQKLLNTVVSIFDVLFHAGLTDPPVRPFATLAMKPDDFLLQDLPPDTPESSPTRIVADRSKKCVVIKEPQEEVSDAGYFRISKFQHSTKIINTSW